MSKVKTSVKNLKSAKEEEKSKVAKKKIIPSKPVKNESEPSKPIKKQVEKTKPEVYDYETERKRYAARTPTYEDLVNQVKDLDETLDAYEKWVKQNIKTIQKQEDFIQTLMKKLKSVGFVYVPDEES